MHNDRYQEDAHPNPLLEKAATVFFNVRRYNLQLLLIIIWLPVLFFYHNGQISRFFCGAVSAVICLIILLVRVAFEWERVPILRFGRFSRIKGPGLFLFIPFIDSIIEYVDCRIMVDDFSAEKVLTADAVPIFVDAVVFWMVWDAAKAKLEVKNFRYAVPLSAKTALRDIIGKNSLTRLLTDRDGIGKQLRKILDEKTNPWGITSLSVEIKDIIIPEELENVMSKEAQAEREKKARLIIGSAEVEISKMYSDASGNYEKNEIALTLRALNILGDALKTSSSMILVPSEVPHAMNKGISAAIAKAAEQIEKSKISGAENE